MSVFSRGTASRSRVRTVLGGIAIAGASALVLAGCAGGGGSGRASESAAARSRISPSRSAPSCPRPAASPSSARPRRPASACAVNEINEAATPASTVDVDLRRLGRHRQQGVRDHDPEAAERGRRRHDRRRVVGCRPSCSSTARRRGHHHVLAGQHVARLHHVGRQRPVLAHRSQRPAPGRGARQPDRRGRPQEHRHHLPERLLRHRPGRRRQGGLRGQPAARSSPTPSYNTGDTSFDAQIATILAANPDAIVLITFDEFTTIAPLLVQRGLARREPLPRRRKPQAAAATDVPGRLSLEGAKGTTPGPVLADDFQRASERRLDRRGQRRARRTTRTRPSRTTRSSCSRSPRSRPARPTRPTIAEKLQEVSGGSGDGEKCTTFADCADIIIGGGVADYDGYSGPITFDEDGDPTEATIGIFQYGADNKYDAHQRGLTLRSQRGPRSRSGALRCPLCAARRREHAADATQQKSGCR